MNQDVGCPWVQGIRTDSAGTEDNLAGIRWGKASVKLDMLLNIYIKIPQWGKYRFEFYRRSYVCEAVIWNFIFICFHLVQLSGNDGIKDCVDSDRVQKSWWTKWLHQEQRKYLPMYRILSTSPVSVALEQPLGGSATQTRCWWSCGQFPFTRTGECVKVKIGLNISLLCIMFTAIYVTSNYHRVHPIRFIPSKISIKLNHCFKIFQF